MAFIGMFFIGVVIFALILGFLFLLGLILLIVGIVRKKNPKNAGKKSPIVCIVLGALCLLPPVGVTLYFVIGLLITHFAGQAEYDHVTDAWRNKYVYIGDTRAGEEAIEGLLTSADTGDRDYFEKMFPQRVREREGFAEAVDAFFESYPNGLSFCEWDGRCNDTNCEFDVRTARGSYTCVLDGEWYSMEFELCYENLNSPDEVGVTFFCIENLEANALDRDYGENEFLVCAIMDESEVTARLIDGNAYVFTPTPDRSITVEEMKTYLKKYHNTRDLTGKIGWPNAKKQFEYSNAEAYYYELVPENGKPRYMYIRTSGYGEIYDFYICSDAEEITD